MTERPMLFSDAMVRAIIAGAKTQTRRVVEPARGMQSQWLTAAMIGRSPALTISRLSEKEPEKRWRGRLGASMEHPGGGPLGWVSCPYGQPGDRLWVREGFALIWPDGHGPPEDERECSVEYRADGDASRAPGEWPSDRRNDPDAPRWRPSIHMPRWASRLTLEVTSVRVERVQSISAEDAVAEGIFGEGRYATSPPLPYPVATFRELWDSINGKREGCSWSANPWVWVVGFKRVEER